MRNGRKSCLEVSGGPLFVLAIELALDPGNGDGGPDASPQEGEDPAELRID